MVEIGLFKRIFKKTSEEAVSAIELKEWLSAATEKKMSALDNSIVGAYQEFHGNVKKAKDKLKGLEEARLLPDLSPRDIHLLEGSRITYIKKLREFLDSIARPGGDYDSILDYCIGFEERLTEANRNVSKQYHSLKEHLEGEVSSVAEALKEMDNNMLRIRSLVESEDIKGLRSLFRDIRQLNELIVKENQSRKKIEELDAELKSAQEKKGKITAKADKLRGSSYFSEFSELDAKKKEAQRALDELSADIRDKLQIPAKLARKLPDYPRYESLIAGYMDNPASAIKGDESLVISEFVEAFKDEVRSGRLVPPEEIAAKIAAQVEPLDKGFFSAARSKVIELLAKSSDLNRSMERNSIAMNFKESEYLLEHLERKIGQIEDEISRLKSGIEGLQIPAKIRDVEERLMRETGVKVLVRTS